MSDDSKRDDGVSGQVGKAAQNVTRRETQQVRNEMASEIRQRTGWLNRIKSLIGR